MAAWHGSSKNGRVELLPPIEEYLSARRCDASPRASRVFSDSVKEEKEQIELAAAAERCSTLADALETWMTQDEDSAVYWLETSGKLGENQVSSRAPRSKSAPILATGTL